MSPTPCNVALPVPLRGQVNERRGSAPADAPPEISEWTAEAPSVRGWYWLRHAVFQTALGKWHEPVPTIVELVPDASGQLLVYVSGTTWTRSVADLIVGEWSGPLAMPR